MWFHGISWGLASKTGDFMGFHGVYLQKKCFIAISSDLAINNGDSVEHWNIKNKKKQVKHIAI